MKTRELTTWAIGGLVWSLVGTFIAFKVALKWDQISSANLGLLLVVAVVNWAIALGIAGIKAQVSASTKKLRIFIITSTSLSVLTYIGLEIIAQV